MNQKMNDRVARLQGIVNAFEKSLAKILFLRNNPDIFNSRFRKEARQLEFEASQRTGTFPAPFVVRTIKIIFLYAVIMLPICCSAIEIAKVEGSKWYKNNVPENSIDGKPETSYTGVGDDAQISYYFKEPGNIESIELHFNKAWHHRPGTFSVMLQRLDGSWQTVRQFTKVPGEVERICLENAFQAKAMRIAVSRMSKSKDFGLREVIFNRKSDINLKPWGGIKIARIIGSKWYKDDIPEKSIDGKLETAYTGIEEPSRLILQFEKTEKISRITILFHRAYVHRPGKCTISLLQPNGNWVTVKKFEMVPGPLEEINLKAPVAAKALKLQAAQLSSSKDLCIRELILNQKAFTNTRNSDIPRPPLAHKKEINVQFFFPLKKFFHYGQGILFYSTPDIPDGRVEAVMVITPLSVDKTWFIGQTAQGVHVNTELLPDNSKLMKYSLQGPSGIHKFTLHNNKDKVVLDQAYKPVNNKYSQNVIANGLVLRFPYYMWKQAEWQIGNRRGHFIPSDKPDGKNLKKEQAEFIDMKETETPVKLVFSLPAGKIEVTPENFKLSKAVILNKNGIFGFFTDVCLVPAEGRCRTAGKQRPFKCRWDIKFIGRFVRSWKEAYELSDTDVVELGDTDPGVLDLENISEVYAGTKIDTSYQIMDKSSPFYGANFKLGHEALAQEIPLSTRSFALKLAARAAATKDLEAFKRASLALDYLTSTISNCRQYGDIRMGIWSVKPFMWDAISYVRAIEYMRLAGADKEKLIYWRSGARLLYIGGINEVLEKMKFKTDIGANIATYALQISILSRYFKDARGMKAALKGIEYALSPSPGEEDGIKQDYSYRHGNIFDIGYYRWLNETSGNWERTHKGTKLALQGESLKNYNKMNNAIIWMYDNGMLNTMTAHGKNRLCFNRSGFPEFFKPWFRTPVERVGEIKKTKDIRQIEKYVADSPEFPTGFYYFNIAGLLVERSKQVYMSLWWNPKVKVRDNLHSGVNSNYNTKVPFASYYLRVRNAPREVTIPGDNYHYSGAVLAPGMKEMEDWAHCFCNSKGSKVYQPVFFDGGAVLCAEVYLRARKAPDKVAKYFMTVLLTPTGMVRCITAPKQSSAPELSEYPMVLRQYQSTPVNVNDIKANDKYETFMLCWKRLAGEVCYKWTLSENNVDGAQRYSYLSPAKVRILEGKLKLSQPLTTAWELRALNTPPIASRLDLTLKKHEILLKNRTAVIVDYNTAEVTVNGKTEKLIPVL